MTTEQVIAIAEVGAVLAAGIAIFMTVRGLRDQLWLHTFSEYTKRHSEIVCDLPSESRRPHGDFDIDSIPREERERVLSAARGYFNLCSEELFLYHRGKIDKETWAIWRNGIVDTVRLPWIQGTWKLTKVEYSFFPNFCEFMDGLVAKGNASEASTAEAPVG